MHASRTILVIGGGPAGTFAAIAAKKQDAAAAVVLLTEERCEPYEKPPLSKAVLLGKVQASDAPIAGPGGLASHGVVLRTGARCAAIDRDARAVVLSDGTRLSYDALVVATGASVRELGVLPEGMPRVHYLRSVKDADALKAALGTCTHLLVVGGGLIGLEVAASAAALGIRTTVLEVAPRILSRVCYADIADTVQAAHRQRGVDVRLNTRITSADARADAIIITTADGATVSADAVVVGTGAKPDDALAAAAGLMTHDGIVVNEQCRTSDPRIFAAGDAVRFPGPDGLVRLENWKHALDQGAVAGRNAAGANETYATLPSFWSEQYDLYIQGVGWPVPTAACVRRPMPGNAALTFAVSEERVVYALGINVQRDLAVVRRLIERRISVDIAALADPGQPLATLLKR